MIWLVYTGWQGNGAEGVIVDAATEDDARAAAYATVTATITADLNRRGHFAPRRAALQSRLDGDAARWHDWEVVQLDLPHIAEFS